MIMPSMATPYLLTSALTSLTDTALTIYYFFSFNACNGGTHSSGFWQIRSLKYTSIRPIWQCLNKALMQHNINCY